MNKRITINFEKTIFKGMVKRDGEWSKTAQKLSEVRASLRTLNLVEAELKEQLLELSEGVNSFDENGFIYKSSERPGTIDYKTAQKELNIDLEPYRKESITAWLFSKVDIK